MEMTSNFQSQFPKPHEKYESKFSDHSADALHRLPNTSANTEAAVHRYSTKELL